MILPLTISISTLLISVAIASEDNLVNGQCEDNWIEEYSIGLGCLFIYRGSSTFDEAREFCEKRNSSLIELDSKNQLDRVSVLLKTESGDHDHTKIKWWGGAIQLGPEEDRNWTWIESGEPVQDWVWGPSEPGTGENDNHFVLEYRASENESYYGRDFDKNNPAFPVCQRPQISTINGGQSGELSGGAETQTLFSLPLIVGASAGGLVVVGIIIGAVWCFKKRCSRSGLVEKNEIYGEQEDYYEDENTIVTDRNQLYGDKEYADECDFE